MCRFSVSSCHLRIVFTCALFFIHFLGSWLMGLSWSSVIVGVFITTLKIWLDVFPFFASASAWSLFWLFLCALVFFHSIRSPFSWMVFWISFSSVLYALHICCLVELVFLWIALIALLLSVCNRTFWLVGLIMTARHIACSSVCVESLAVGALANIVKLTSV